MEPSGVQDLEVTWSADGSGRRLEWARVRAVAARGRERREHPTSAALAHGCGAATRHVRSDHVPPDDTGIPARSEPTVRVRGGGSPVLPPVGERNRPPFWWPLLDTVVSDTGG
jgi:hypothetical protein